MPRDTWLVPALTAFALGGAFFWWVYFRREFSVPSRSALFVTRLVTLSGVVLLLWNPALPWGAGRGAPRFVILDGSASMGAATADGGSPWAAAVERAGSLAAGDGYRILVAGSQVSPVEAGDLEGWIPNASRSELTGALRVAAEAGARDVVLLTDRRVEDPLASSALVDQLQMTVAVDSLPVSGPNVGVARLTLPASVERGEPIRGRAEIQGAGSGDSVTVSVDVDGQTVQTLSVPSPSDEGLVAVDFDLPSNLAAGSRVVEVRIEEEDSFGGDDRRARVVVVDPEETGVLLVAFQPDWEARFLFPVLAQATGLPARGYIRIGEDRFLPLNRTDTPAVSAATLGRLMSRAELLVAMGVDESARPLLEGPSARARRLLLFPADPAGAALGGVDVGVPLAGEWYVDEPPPSPIAGALGDFLRGGLPPRTRVLPVVDDGGGDALGIRLGGAGRPEPALVLRQQDRRRTAVALARGFWRWGFRDGEPRERYRRLWSAVGGWMLADEPLAAGPGVRPVDAVLPRGVPTRWQGWGYEGDSVRVTVTDEGGSPAADTLFAVPQGGLFDGPLLPPGRYGFMSVLGADSASGSFVVEEFTGDMLHRPLDPSVLAARGERSEVTRGGTRPLRTSSLPYLLVLVALCGEWIGRRRAGLR